MAIRVFKIVQVLALVQALNQWEIDRAAQLRVERNPG